MVPPKRIRKFAIGRRGKWGQLRRDNYLAYVSWCSMRQRCLDPKHRSYDRYGGAGVVVCDRWASFETFLADMGPRTSKETTLDRIDGERGYEPGNCRWAPMPVQSRNKRSMRWFSLNGDPVLLGDICRLVGIKYSTADMRLRRGWTPFATFLCP